MKIQTQLQTKLQEGLQPLHLDIINESPQHNVPDGAESHFRLVLVSDQFSDKKLVQRHQLVYKLLAGELQSSIHALSMHTFTPSEWEARGGETAESPRCRDGSEK